MITVLAGSSNASSSVVDKEVALAGAAWKRSAHACFATSAVATYKSAKVSLTGYRVAALAACSAVRPRLAKKAGS